MEVENYTKRESIPLIPVTNDYSKIEEGLFLGKIFNYLFERNIFKNILLFFNVYIMMWCILG